MSASSRLAASSHTALFFAGAADLGSALEVLRPSLGRPREPIVLFGPTGVPTAMRASFDQHFEEELRPSAAETTVRLVESHRDADEHISRLTRAIDDLSRRGAELVRVLGMAGWETPGWPLPEDHIWAESRTSEALRGLRADVTCAYDVTSLPGPALIYAGLETHPVIRINGTSITNDRPITPASFVSERLPQLPWLTRRPSTATAERGIHACAFFMTRDEEYATLVPFIKDGIAAGQGAVQIVDPERREDHVRRLAQAGVTGRPDELLIRVWPETYQAEGRFSAERMLATLRALLSAAPGGTHLVADMAWALQQAPGVDEIVEYESRLNDSMPGRLDTVICTYDSARFAGPTLIDILRGHPHVILGGVLQENDLHISSETLSRERRQRAQADGTRHPPRPSGGIVDHQN